MVLFPSPDRAFSGTKTTTWEIARKHNFNAVLGNFLEQLSFQKIDQFGPKNKFCPKLDHLGKLFKKLTASFFLILKHALGTKWELKCPVRH